MKTALLATFAVVFAGVILVALYLQRFRIQPLTESSFSQPRMRKATDLFCTHYATEDVSRRPIFVEHIHDPNSSIALIRIDDETMPARQAHDLLHSVYSVRAERVVFVVDPPEANIHGDSDVLNMIKHLGVIDQVCVIDPTNPPAWYPPKKIAYPRLTGL
jgi:uncharacterized membrane protein YukC